MAEIILETMIGLLVILLGVLLSFICGYFVNRFILKDECTSLEDMYLLTFLGFLVFGFISGIVALAYIIGTSILH